MNSLLVANPWRGKRKVGGRGVGRMQPNHSCSLNLTCPKLTRYVPGYSCKGVLTDSCNCYIPASASRILPPASMRALMNCSWPRTMVCFNPNQSSCNCVRAATLGNSFYVILLSSGAGMGIGVGVVVMAMKRILLYSSDRLLFEGMECRLGREGKLLDPPSFSFFRPSFRFGGWMRKSSRQAGSCCWQLGQTSSSMLLARQLARSRSAGMRWGQLVVVMGSSRLSRSCLFSRTTASMYFSSLRPKVYSKAKSSSLTSRLFFTRHLDSNRVRTSEQQLILEVWQHFRTARISVPEFKTKKQTKPWAQQIEKQVWFFNGSRRRIFQRKRKRQFMYRMTVNCCKRPDDSPITSPPTS